MTSFRYSESSKDICHLSSLNANSSPRFSTLFTGLLSHTNLMYTLCCWLNSGFTFTSSLEHFLPLSQKTLPNLHVICRHYFKKQTTSSFFWDIFSINSNSKLLDLSGSHGISGHRCTWFSLHIQTYLAKLTHLQKLLTLNKFCNFPIKLQSINKYLLNIY